jgi:hypothetical protein
MKNSPVLILHVFLLALSTFQNTFADSPSVVINNRFDFSKSNGPEDDLVGTRSDHNIFKSVFCEGKTCNISDSHPIFKSNDPEKVKAAYLRKLELEARGNPNIAFNVTGHGTEGKDGKYQIPLPGPSGASVSFDEVGQAFQRAGVKKVAGVLDTCHSGACKKSAGAFKGMDYKFLHTTQANEYASDESVTQSRLNPFTIADANRDGKKSFNEVAAGGVKGGVHVTEVEGACGKPERNSQTPGVFSSGGKAGEMVVDEGKGSRKGFLKGFFHRN